MWVFAAHTNEVRALRAGLFGLSLVVCFMSSLFRQFVLGFTVSLFSTGVLAQSNPADFETSEFYANWGLAPIKAQYAWSQGFTGAGVRIAIVDTPAQITHPEFAGRVVGAVPTNEFPVPGFPIPIHGTHVMGLAGAARNDVGMIGSAFDAQLLSVVNGNLGNPGYFGVTNWGPAVVAYGATVMNGSFVIEAQPKRVVNNAENPHWREIRHLVAFPEALEGYVQNIDVMAQHDVVMVFAAGNNRAVRNNTPGGVPWVPEQLIATRIPDFPGSLPLITPTNSQADDPLYRLLLPGSQLSNPDTWSYLPLSEYASVDLSYLAGSLIAVVATDQNNQIAEFSNRCGVAANWCLAAPGLDLWSTVPVNTYQNDFGTSMSAPLVAGGAALVRLAFPYMTARQVIEVLLTTATQLGDASIYGHGLLNLEKAVQGPIEFGHPSLIPGQASIFAPVFAVDTKGHDSMWRNDISGVGGFSKAGDGMLTLTGNNTYTGATTITGGTLRVDGSIAPSSLTIGSQATLQGTGVVGNTAIAGVLSPGNSVGTLTVRGDLILDEGATYRFEIDRQQQSDQVVVSGTATLAANAVFELSAEDGIYLDQVYPMLQSASLVGTFDNLHTNYTFIDLNFLVSRTSAWSEIGMVAQRNDTSMASFAQTNNQRAVATAIDQQSPGDEPFNAVVLNDDPSQLPNMYQDWSGEIYSANQAALLYNSRLLAQVVNWRLQDGWHDGTVTRLQQVGQANADTTMWAQAYGNWDSFSANADAQKATANSGGFLIGLDHQVIPELRLGGGFAASVTTTTVAASQAQTSGYHVLLYGAYERDALRLSGGLVQSWYSANVNRTLPFDDQGNARGTVASNSTQLFADLSTPIVLHARGLASQGPSQRTTLWPFAQVSQTWLRTANFGETGAEAALSGQSANASVGFGSLGARLQHQWQTDQTVWQATLSAGLQRAWGDLSPTTSLAFATGPDFTVSAAPIARNSAVIEVGLGASLGPSSRFNLVYLATLAGQSSSQMLQAQLLWRF